jgi:hypothetical protein
MNGMGSGYLLTDLKKRHQREEQKAEGEQIHLRIKIGSGRAEADDRADVEDYVEREHVVPPFRDWMLLGIGSEVNYDYVIAFALCSTNAHPISARLK